MWKHFLKKASDEIWMFSFFQISWDLRKSSFFLWLSCVTFGWLLGTNCPSKLIDVFFRIGLVWWRHKNPSPLRYLKNLKKWKPERARRRDFQNPKTLQNTKKLFPIQILMITVLYTRMCLERHQERQDQGGKNRRGTNLFRFKRLLSQLGILRVSYFKMKFCSIRWFSNERVKNFKLRFRSKYLVKQLINCEKNT